MLKISKSLSAGKLENYHRQEFTSPDQSYWSQGQTVQGEWQGQLAEKYGLAGAVNADEFHRLSEGEHPRTGEQLVQHRQSFEYQDANGKTIKSAEHRAGWDATFSAPKSVSLTALVGGDSRVREAHRTAVTTALGELERYTQARIGGNHPAESTGQFIVAKFEHDTSRPVDGYAAPQLHTHAVIFNVTERADGVREIFVDGSFVEDKDHPNDIDGYFVCDLMQLASGDLAQQLNRLDPYKVWTWDPASRRPYRGYPKRQLRASKKPRPCEPARVLRPPRPL